MGAETSLAVFTEGIRLKPKCQQPHTFFLLSSFLIFLIENVTMAPVMKYNTVGYLAGPCQAVLQRSHHAMSHNRPGIKKAYLGERKGEMAWIRGRVRQMEAEP